MFFISKSNINYLDVINKKFPKINYKILTTIQNKALEQYINILLDNRYYKPSNSPDKSKNESISVNLRQQFCRLKRKAKKLSDDLLEIIDFINIINFLEQLQDKSTTQISFCKKTLSSERVAKRKRTLNIEFSSNEI